ECESSRASMRFELRAECVVLRTHHIARSQQAAIRRCLPRLIMVASRGNESDGVQNDSSELPLSTHTRRMRFSGPLTGVLCKRPFPEFVVKIRIQRQRSSADIYRSCEQNCNRPAAFKNATVRERPEAEVGSSKSGR